MESQETFERTLTEFRKGLPFGRQYALEIRNGNYMNERFLDYLLDQEWDPVFLQGYWMPPVINLWRKMERRIRAFSTIIFRLHGTGREAIEEETGKVWNQIVISREKELADIAGIVSHLAADGKEIYINVNNHFEGSAPLTIDRFMKFFQP
jgi:uncharacterized protein YecE (DUF72 family)